MNYAIRLGNDIIRARGESIASSTATAVFAMSIVHPGSKTNVSHSLSIPEEVIRVVQGDLTDVRKSTASLTRVISNLILKRAAIRCELHVPPPMRLLPTSQSNIPANAAERFGGLNRLRDFTFRLQKRRELRRVRDWDCTLAAIFKP